jgi:hypothetical protein
MDEKFGCTDCKPVTDSKRFPVPFYSFWFTLEGFEKSELNKPY